MRVGFFTRNGVRSLRSSGRTFARISEFGGTSPKPYALQSFSFRFWSWSRSVTLPVLTASIISRENETMSGSSVEDVPCIGLLLRLLGSRLELVHEHDG